MSKWALGKRADHKKFCQNESWSLAKGATGQLVSHHLTYELHLNSGDILRTRISKPANGVTYSKKLWGTILNKQLCVSDREFWDCVKSKVLPARSSSKSSTPRLKATLPLPLFFALQNEVKMKPHDISALTLNEAQQVLDDHYSGK